MSYCVPCHVTTTTPAVLLSLGCWAMVSGWYWWANDLPTHTHHLTYTHMPTQYYTPWCAYSQDALPHFVAAVQYIVDHNITELSIGKLDVSKQPGTRTHSNPLTPHTVHPLHTSHLTQSTHYTLEHPHTSHSPPTTRFNPSHSPPTTHSNPLTPHTVHPLHTRTPHTSHSPPTTHSNPLTPHTVHPLHTRTPSHLTQSTHYTL